MKVALSLCAVQVLALVWVRGSALPVLEPLGATQASLSAAGVVFDPARPVVYAVEASPPRLVAVSLNDGAVTKEYPLARPAGTFTVSPNGRWLALSLPPLPETGATTAEVMLVDLERQTAGAPFPIALVPASLVVTDAGMVVVSDSVAFRREGYFSLVMSYDGPTGTELGLYGNSVGTGLALSGDQRTVFAGEHDMVRQFSLDPVTGAIDFAGLSSVQAYPVPVGYTLHTLADGVHVVSRGGWLNAGAGSGRLLTAEHTFESVSSDARNRAFLVVAVSRTAADQVGVLQYHSESFELAAVYRVGASARFLQVRGDSLDLVSPEPGRLLLERFRNPALGGDVNVAPVAAFTWLPAEPTTVVPVAFDGSATADESPASLLYRWDWNGDGLFDTAWSSAAQAARQFSLAGGVSVTLQVKDRYGVVHQATRTLTVTQASDPGVPASPHAPFDLPFAAKDVAFDPAQPLAYAADEAGQRVVRLNLIDGLAEREFRLDKLPQALALTPDGRRLYAALWLRPRPAVSGLPPGYLAEFDLGAGTKTREYAVDREVASVLPLAQDTLVASYGSRELNAYSALTGQRLSGLTTSFFSAPILAAHPSATHFYLLGNSSVDRYALDPATGQLQREGAINVVNLSGGLFASPAGAVAINGGGRVLSLAEDWRQDLRLLQLMHTGLVRAVSYDLPRRSILLLGTASYSASAKTNLYHYHADSYAYEGMYPVTNGTRYVKAWPDYVYTVAVRTNSTLFSRFIHPVQELRLEALGWSSESGFRLQIGGAPGQRLELLGSDDLEDWRVLQALTLTEQPMVWLDSSASGRLRFYRARQAPP
ncbi:MAG: hypothetical protein FJ387_22975 [Verrucomicrobia bacterium]|nr:hypothetical protein [Verrucomicrobiota bacterium]